MSKKLKCEVLGCDAEATHRCTAKNPIVLCSKHAQLHAIFHARPHEREPWSVERIVNSPEVEATTHDAR